MQELFEDTLSTSTSITVDKDLCLAESLSTVDSIRVDKHIVLSDVLSTKGALAQQYGDLLAVRNHPHTSRWYLAVKVPRIICRYTVTEDRQDEADNTISVGEPTYAAPFDGYLTTLPTLFDYLEDATVWVGSEDTAATRTNHGRGRLRRVGEGELTVGADMHCDWRVGDTVCIVDLWELWPKLHRVETDEKTVTMWKDTDLEVSLRKEYPVAVFGPPACAFLKEGKATVIFDGSQSYKVQPNSLEYDGTSPEGTLGWARQGIDGYAWTLEGATVPTPDTARVSAEYEAPGQYLAFLKVTDRDGLTSFGVRNVFIYDDPNAPLDPKKPVLPETEFRVERLSGSLDSKGWQAELEVFGSLYDPQELASGAQAVLFAEEWFGGTERRFGLGHLYRTGRMNIKMVGWLADSRIVYRESGGREARLAVRGLQQYLKSATNYATYMTQADDDAPAWAYFTCPDDGLTVRKYLYHLVQWHYTLLRFTDYLIPDDHNNYMPGMEAPEGSLDVQLDALVRRTQARWATDKGGCLHVFSWPNYLPITGEGAVWRARLYTENELGTGDLRSLEIVPRLRDTVARVRVESVISFQTGAYQTAIDTAPGDVRNFGGANVVLGQQVIGTGGFEGSQGWELARMVHAEESRGIEEISLPMLGNYSHFDVVPAMGWTQVTVLGGLRGVAWTRKPFWVTGMRIEVDHEHGDTGTTLTLFPETMMSPSIRSYGQYDEVGEKPKEETGEGYFDIAGAIGEEGEPDEVEIPALLGDGAGHVETGTDGFYYARLFGDLTQGVIVDARNLKPVDGRPVTVRQTRGSIYTGTAGKSLYTVRDVRRNWGEEGTEWEDRAYQWHRGVLGIPGSLRVGTGMAAIALPVTGQRLQLVRVEAYLRHAPIIGDGESLAEVFLTRNGSMLAGVSFDGESSSASAPLIPLWLEDGDVLDLDVVAVPATYPGADLTVTAVCKEYGI